jgi:glutathione-regulated potassium-efflux system ancillary protein KefG
LTTEYYRGLSSTVNFGEADEMAPRVRTEDLIDAQGVADLLRLAQRTSVSVYQQRYPDMPRPVVNLGSGRSLLWLKPEIVNWARETGRLK